MKERKSFLEAIEEVRDGSSLMIGGFMCCGQALGLIEALIEKGVQNLTVICNDAGLPGKGVGKLIELGRVHTLIASHIGLNPIAGQKMHEGSMKIELVPQGTLAERIRAGGAGLGGVLTPTGLGTQVEHGKTKLVIEGKEFLVETALKADFAFVMAHEVDSFGNAFIEKSAKNFNTIMAMASQHTIVESLNIVEELHPEKATIPSVFVKSYIRGVQ